MVEPLINWDQEKILRDRVRKLSENEGIDNQIIHLRSPDDNEVYDYVFQYLENEINRVIEGWCSLKLDIQRIKKENK